MENKNLAYTFFICLLSIAYTQDKWKIPGFVIRMPEPLYIGVGTVFTVEAANLESQKPRNYYRDAWTHASNAYLWHNVHYRIIYKEVWTAPKISLEKLVNDSSYDTALDKWKEHARNYNLADVSVLQLIYDSITVGKKIGVSFIDSFPVTCHSVLNVGKRIKNNVVAAGIVAAHETGHCLGLNHLESKNCIHSNNNCVMSETLSAKVDSYPNGFSADTINILLTKNLGILSYNLAGSPNIYPRCGDGYIDPGEECDCGFEQNCILLEQDGCCNFETCKLRWNTQCSSGKCCQNCRFLRDTLCRASIGECDKEERCNGKMAECPFDDNVPDGTPCLQNTQYCSNGRCGNYSYKCSLYTLQSVNSIADCTLQFLLASKQICSKNASVGSICDRDVNECSYVVCGSEKKLSVELAITFTPSRTCGIIQSFMPSETNRDTSGLSCGSGMGCYGGRCIDAAANVQKCKDVRCPMWHVCMMGACVRNGAQHTLCQNVRCKSDEACGVSGKCVPVTLGFIRDKRIDTNTIIGYVISQLLLILWSGSIIFLLEYFIFRNLKEIEL